MEAQIGQIVKAHNKSGTYIGEVLQDRDRKYLVKVLAVVKHPMQGDLHNPGQTENVFFHERKALSYNEKVNVSKSAVHAYDDEIPAYDQSLKKAVNDLKTKLQQEESEFNQQALNTLTNLEGQYFNE